LAHTGQRGGHDGVLVAAGGLPDDQGRAGGDEAGDEVGDAAVVVGDAEGGALGVEVDIEVVLGHVDADEGG
jgi:hypothetical protein